MVFGPHFCYTCIMKITKNALFYPIIAGLFLIPFIPFIVSNSMFFPFVTGKGFAFRILVEILFGLFAILVFVAPEYRPKLSWITKSTIFFTLAILIADLLSVNAYKSLWSNYERMEGFVLIAHLFLYYIVASSVLKTKVDWRRFFNISIFASVIMSLYGFLQLAGKITINQGGVRVDATFGNAAYLAIYIVFHMFLSIYMFFDEASTRLQKQIYAGVFLIEAIILYHTATRGAILGLIGGLALTGLILVWKGRENKVLLKWAGILVGGVVALVIGFFLLRNTPVVQKSPVLARFSTLGVSEFQGQGRYFVWPMAIKGVLDKPVFGWGQESFNFVFNKYYDPQLFGQEEWFDRTHNVFLDWLIAGGIVGFLAYASMYLALVYFVWRRESKLNLYQKSIFTGMIAAYVFHNMFVFDNLVSYIMFFSVLAYVHAISVEDKTESGVFYTKTFSDNFNVYVVTPVAFVVLVGTIYFVNAAALRANWTLISALTPQKEGVAKNIELFKKVYAYKSFGSTEATEQLVETTTKLSVSQAPEDVKKNLYAFASEKIEEKIVSTPHDARYMVFGGALFNSYGDYERAIKYLEDALLESPEKQSIYFELGTVYLRKKDPVKAFELFKKAYDLNPSSSEARNIYAVGAIRAKNAEVLKELAPLISENTIVSDNRFLQAYADIGDYGTVIKILNTRIQKDPTNMQYQLSLASAYATIGQRSKSIEIIQGMIKQNPEFKTEGEGYIKQLQGN